MIYVECPETPAEIGSKAFSGCENLKKIYIPESTVNIAADALEGGTELTILGTSGNYAEYYVWKYGYSFCEK